MEPCVLGAVLFALLRSLREEGRTVRQDVDVWVAEVEEELLAIDGAEEVESKEQRNFGHSRVGQLDEQPFSEREGRVRDGRVELHPGGLDESTLDGLLQHGAPMPFFTHEWREPDVLPREEDV